MNKIILAFIMLNVLVFSYLSDKIVNINSMGARNGQLVKQDGTLNSIMEYSEDIEVDFTGLTPTDVIYTWVETKEGNTFQKS